MHPGNLANDPNAQLNSTTQSPNVARPDLSSIIPHVTPDQIKSIFNRLTELKAQGAHQTQSQEYVKLLEFLRAYSAYKNKVQAQAQAQAQLQAQPQVQQVSLPNLATGNNAIPNSVTEGLNPHQIEQLSNQITSYKYLSKNLPVPTDELGTFDSKTLVQPNLDQATNPETKILGYLPPSNILNKPRSQLQRLLIPSLMPTGLDPYTIAHERQERINTRIRSRIAELESLPSNLSNTSIIEDIDINLGPKEKVASVKLRALIELKGLKLSGLQRRLRERVIQGMSQSTTLITSLDRNSFRRMKRQTLKEARYTEKLERQQRAEREKRERQKHLDFLSGIVKHGKDMLQWNRGQQITQGKIGRMVLQFHSQVEKEIIRADERKKRERMEALKAGDEQAYIALIDKEKDVRITQLLAQTDDFLNTLANSVVAQQTDDAYYGVNKDITAPRDPKEQEIFENAQDERYYSTAHRVKEEIKEQSSNLVGGTLKDYQLKGLEWMVSLYNNRLNGILADEMGLGKTIQTISLVSYLIDAKKQNGPYLILVPLSTIPNWSMEFEKWAPSISKVVYKGDPNERKSIQRDYIKHQNFQVLITTFEYIIKDKAVLAKIKWLHMIIDEGHRMKNATSKLAITLNQFYSTRYRLILTGTPLQNNLPELWSLLNFVLPRIFNSASTFDEWFNSPFASTGTEGKELLNEEEVMLIIKRLHKVLRPFLLRRLKKDVESELPDKVEKIVKCEMSLVQSKVYNRIASKESLVLQADGKGARVTSRSLNNTIMQLRKVCNHPFVFREVEDEINPRYENGEILYRVSGKFELLDRILPKFFKTGHRVLIFFQMTSIMTIFEDFMLTRGVKPLRLDGTTKQEERAEYLKLFNDPESEYKLFILSTRAGGLGLNLQTADTVIIFDSDWNPHQDLQAQDRAHRIGQKKDVLILRLIILNSVEEKILERAQFKLDMDGKVIQAGKFDNKSTAMEREALLRALVKQNVAETNNDKEAGEYEELNREIARTPEEFKIFMQMDLDRENEKERQWIESGRTGPIPERLIQEHELPKSFLAEKKEIIYDEEEVEVLGRGRRAKGMVIYNDGLTDEQFVEAIEKEDADLDQVIKEKRDKRLSRLHKKLNKAAGLDSPNSTPSSFPVGSDEGKLKRRRRTQLQPTSDVDRPKPNSSRGGRYDPLSPGTRDRFTEQMMDCIKAMEDLKDKDNFDRSVSYLFNKKPSKKDYPDYYALIKRPISLFEIRKNIRNAVYNTPEELKEDCDTMFGNARIYNEEGSMVYDDANKLEVNKFSKTILKYLYHF
ncbi:hypothetical protein K502DRAFT_287160 [Neoconidiobolus thromboides FSU 785]|nr:hypothetical protein K502DRAFT_287160 [Neoconidiobolus thromboides FSU 785]